MATLGSGWQGLTAVWRGIQFPWHHQPSKHPWCPSLAWHQTKLAAHRDSLAAFFTLQVHMHSLHSREELQLAVEPDTLYKHMPQVCKRGHLCTISACSAPKGTDL